jgi:glycosyltransferase involved in cell wall biosynthesis
MCEVQALVAKYGLDEDVVFLGQADHLEDILPVADVMLLPSHHESFGLVALEAMACGVVPVMTSVGGASEFINDGQNGFLRDPVDISGMAQAIGWLVGSDQLRRNMAEDARRDATMDFGATCIMRRYLDLYETLI